MIDQLKPLLGKLAVFSQERLGFKNPPKLFLRNDSQNSQQALGKTAFYNPQEKSITLFIHGRHPKDIMRSFAHELVHHCQNERGDLSPDKMTSTGDGYAQECPHMRKMEKEAYLKGNMCFRDWEDTIEDKDKFLIKLAESKFLKENKTMTTKITKELLKEMIEKILLENSGKGGKVIKIPPVTITAGEEETKKEKEARERTKDLPTMQALKKPIGEQEEIEEGGCKTSPGRREIEEMEEGQAATCSHCEGKGCPKCEVRKEGEELEENEELEEAEGHPLDVAPPFKGKPDAKDFEKLRAGAKPRNKNESKIQTPEQENSLYENRFAPRNNRLFEKLVKEWTK